MVVRLVTPGLRPANAKVVASDVSSVANGSVIASDGDALVASDAERPLGIVVDDIPTTNPPKFLRLAVTGDTIEDTGLVSQTVGVPIWSDGDGTYSVTDPAPATGTFAWQLGFIRASDASSTIIELDFQTVEGA